MSSQNRLKENLHISDCGNFGWDGGVCSCCCFFRAEEKEGGSLGGGGVQPDGEGGQGGGGGGQQAGGEAGVRNADGVVEWNLEVFHLTSYCGSKEPEMNGDRWERLIGPQ